MSIEVVEYSSEREPEDSPLYKLVVPSAGLSAEFLERAQRLLKGAPEELAASFEAGLRNLSSEL